MTVSGSAARFGLGHNPEVPMTDRESFLAAIRDADPRDDVPRLVYADWLEKHGSGDRDAATVEFIRRACPMAAVGRTRTMPRDVYPWIHRNWTRFLPTLLSHAIPVEYARKTAGSTRLEGMERHMGWWDGRWATVRLRLRAVNDTVLVNESIATARFPLQIEFWKGFVTKVNNWYAWEESEEAGVNSGMIRRWIHADQPIAKLGQVDAQTLQYMPNMR